MFGLVTEPWTGPGALGAVVLQGGNNGPSSGRNQLAARLCHRLGQDGYVSLRFDYRGVGESTGVVDRFRIDQPFGADLEAAIACLTGRGVERFVLVGGCFGARTALASAPALAGLEALVLLGAPVRDKEKDEFGTWETVPGRAIWQYALRAIRPRVIWQLTKRERREVYGRLARRTWKARSAGGAAGKDDARVVSAKFMTELESVLGRAIPVLFVYGTVGPGLPAFQRAMGGRLGETIRRVGSQIHVEVLPGRLLADASLAETTIDLVSGWLAAQREVDRPLEATVLRTEPSPGNRRR